MTAHKQGDVKTHKNATAVLAHPIPMAPTKGCAKAVKAAPMPQRARLLAADAVPG